MSNLVPSNGSGLDKPRGGLIRARNSHYSTGEAVKLHGDTQLHDQIERDVDRLVRERLLEAKLKADGMIAKAEEEAVAIVQAAQKIAEEQAMAIIADAEGRRDAVHGEAREEGFRAGFEDATEQVENQTVDLLRGAEQILQGAYEAEKRVMKSFQQQALQLVQHVAKRVTRAELETSPEKMLVMINQAIESLHMTGKVRIVMSAEMLRMIREYGAKAGGTVDSMQRLELTADSQLDLLQLYVLGQEGSFDLTPAIQVEELTAPLAGELPLKSIQQIDASEAAEIETSEAAATIGLTEPLHDWEPEQVFDDLAHAEEMIAEAAEAEAETSPQAATQEYVSFDQLMFETADFDDETERG